jgi:hypothetical protein
VRFWRNLVNSVVLDSQDERNGRVSSLFTKYVQFPKLDVAGSIPVSRTSSIQRMKFPDRKSVEKRSYILRVLEALQFAGSMYYVLFTERPCGSVAGRRPE